ncbi:MAG TPA: hypothetical protein VEA99_12565 [Gemmatimonadaceae bacterium]|nr:hypothetical protein [Gemmatimonadaceae bacterium]
MLAASLLVVSACSDAGDPKGPEASVDPVAGGAQAYVEVIGGEDSDPPPPPVDTMSVSEGGGYSTSFYIMHRATFTSNLEGTRGWIAWGLAKQPAGTDVAGGSEVYYEKGYLRGKGEVRISTRRGSLYIDFARHLDTANAIIHTNCKGERGGACATLAFRGAVYAPYYGRAERVSGRLYVGVPYKQ